MTAGVRQTRRWQASQPRHRSASTRPTMLCRAVGLDQANVEVESALRDRRAKIDGERKRIAGALRMVHQRAQDGGGGDAAERADERPVIPAGPSLPAAVTGYHPRGLVEQMLGAGRHDILRWFGAVSRP